jgi:hypothetical protein
MHQMEIGEAYCRDPFKRILRKFSSYFPRFIIFSMNFGSLNEFLEGFQQMMILKMIQSSAGPIPAHDSGP